MQKKEFGPLTQYTKINSERITNINVRANTLKILEGLIGVNSHDLGFVKDFLGMTPKPKATNEKIDNLGFF